MCRVTGGVERVWRGAVVIQRWLIHCAQRLLSRKPSTLHELTSLVRSAFEGEVPTLLGNRSAAHLGVKKVKEAVADAEKATQLSPEWPKGWFRLGNARASAGDLPGTVEAYSRSLALVRRFASLLRK